TRYPVPQQGLRIGRAPENDVVLPDPNISRQHLVIWATPRGAFLRDLGSQNGTYMGGRRVGSGPEAIPTGALVRIGVTDLRVEVLQGVESSGPPTAETQGYGSGYPSGAGQAGGQYAGESAPRPAPVPYGGGHNGASPAPAYGG